jgi:hypothetical protein
MGRWTTLHLFNDRIFKEKTIPELKGELGDLSNVYLNFMKSHITGGISRFTGEEVNELLQESIKTIHLHSKKFDENFEKNTELDAILDNEACSEFLHKASWHYDFSRFFEYFVFQTCTDYFPHLPCGKWGIRNLATTPNSLANELIGLLEPSRVMFTNDYMGIMGWLTSENVELLFHDRNKINANLDEFSSAFLNILTIAFDNKLGLMFGSDLREEILEMSPQFKLIEKERWANLNTEWLLFKR